MPDIMPAHSSTHLLNECINGEMININCNCASVKELLSDVLEGNILALLKDFSDEYF